MRLILVADTARGTREFRDLEKFYARESRWRNLVGGVKGGKVLPMWERPGRGWFKKD
jgi:hypothetical protein